MKRPQFVCRDEEIKILKRSFKILQLSKFKSKTFTFVFQCTTTKPLVLNSNVFRR